MGALKYGNVVVDFGAVLLRDTFGYPDNVSTLLFLQFQVRIEDAEMELVKESVNVELHLVLEKFILKGFFTGVIAGAFKQGAILLLKINLHLKNKK